MQAPIAAIIPVVPAVPMVRMPIIKKFNNEQKIYDASTFMYTYEGYMHQQTDDSKLSAFSNFLESYPLQWFIKLKERNAPELAIWATLKAAFLTTFVVKNSAAMAFNKLCNRKQKLKESITDYVKDFQELATEAFTTMSEEQRINIFLNNINPDIAAIISTTVNKPDATLNEAFIAADNANNIVQRQNDLLLPQTVAASSSSNGNHYKRYHKRGREDDRDDDEKSNKKTDSKPLRDTSQLTCYHCNKKGHIATQCWIKNPHLRKSNGKISNNTNNNYNKSNKSNGGTKDSDSQAMAMLNTIITTIKSQSSESLDMSS